MNSRGFEDVAVVTAIVAFVSHLDQDVSIILATEPLDRIANAGLYSIIAIESLVLPCVEQADDRHHTELVRPVQYAFQPAHIIGPQRAVGLEGAVVPWLDL